MDSHVMLARNAPGALAKKTPSMATRLLQATALAVMLISVSAATVQADPITCEFGGDGTGDGAGCIAVDPTHKTFDFGLYSFDLDFLSDLVLGPFLITVEDLIGFEPDLATRLGVFSDHVCVPLSGTACVEFDVDDQSGGTQWAGLFNVLIAWLPNTDIAFPNDAGRIRLIHARGDDCGIGAVCDPNGLFVYDTDITIEGSYQPPPAALLTKELGDPAITGRDDNFQLFTVVQAPASVPEPATLLLVTTGIGGLFYRRRRRNAA